MCQLMGKAQWASTYVYTDRGTALVQTPHCSHPSFFLAPTSFPPFPSSSPEELWLPRHCLASGCTWELSPRCTDLSPGTKLETCSWRFVLGAGKLPSTEGKQLPVELSLPQMTACPLSNPGAGRVPCCPALPSQVRKLRPWERRDLPKNMGCAGWKSGGQSVALVQPPTAVPPIQWIQVA